jgi:nucleotide-binding universal stress UspA family protein
MKHIIVTSDLSLESFKAMSDSAQELYNQDEKAKITLLTVIEAPVIIGDPTDVLVAFCDMDELLAQQEKIAREKLKEAQLKYFPGQLAEVVVLRSTSDIATSVTTFAEKESASLLVMASHGRRGFKRFFLGSITESVLRNATVPVLVIPITQE